MSRDQSSPSRTKKVIGALGPPLAQQLGQLRPILLRHPGRLDRRLRIDHGLDQVRRQRERLGSRRRVGEDDRADLVPAPDPQPGEIAGHRSAVTDEDPVTRRPIPKPRP